MKILQFQGSALGVLFHGSHGRKEFQLTKQIMVKTAEKITKYFYWFKSIMTEFT